jgi:hypothetical protein
MSISVSTLNSELFFFVTVTDSLTTCNLLGQGKKLDYGCPHYFRETYSQYLSESQK